MNKAGLAGASYNKVMGGPKSPLVGLPPEELSTPQIPENINYKNYNNRQNKNNKNLILYDEQKLALRFKDEEISDIIKELKENITKIGSKYLVEPESNIDFKKDNNTIQINIELKEA